MPKVPSAPDLGQVAAQGLPGARADSVVTPSFLSGPAERTMAQGAAMQEGGKELGAIVAKIQERDNLDAVFRAEATAKESFLKFQDNVRKTRQGDLAKGVVQDTDKFWNDSVEQIGKGLENDEQRRVFAQRASGLRVTSLGQMADWENRQGEIALDASTSKNIKAARDAAITTPTPENIATQIAEIKKINAVYLQHKGITDPKVLEQANLADTSQIHEQVIRGLAVNAPMQAKAYFEEAKKAGQIEPSKFDELEKLSKNATDRGLGIGAAGEVWKAMRPAKPDDPVRLEDMEDALREKLKDNPDALEKGMADLRTRVQAFTTQRTAESNAAQSAVNQLILKGQNMGQIQNSPAFIELSARHPEAARSIVTFMENRAYTAEARANIREQRDERALYKKNTDLALKMSDPTKLTALSRDEVINMLPLLGPSATAHLVEKWDMFHKDPKKLVEAKIDNDEFNTLADSVGLKPFDPTKSENEKRDLGLLKQKVEERIDAAINGPGGTKKELNREQKRVLMQQILDDHIVTKNKTIWGVPVPFTGGDTPAYTINPNKKEDLKRVPDPPATFTEKVDKARRDQGLPAINNVDDYKRLWLKQKPDERKNYQ